MRTERNETSVGGHRGKRHQYGDIKEKYISMRTEKETSV
jgi:hypothetical protein